MKDGDFKVGETVVLRSGGPLMTVEAIDETHPGGSLIKTVWFDSRGQEMHSQFMQGVLESRRHDPTIG
jgi:uncharacterized protein YodC (DUF2158 family)